MLDVPNNSIIIISPNPLFSDLMLCTSRKAGTAVLTAGTAFYCLFHVDYGSHEHCFSGIQRWYWNKLDSLLGIDKKKLNKISDERGGTT